jgi:hypothetical protein
MSGKSPSPKTPDESIPQDPGIPGPGTKDEGEWPPESGAAAASKEESGDRDAPAEGTRVSEALDRMPRHRADEERETER